MSGTVALVVHPELAQLAAGRQALEASRDLGEVKAIRDTAAAAQRYAQARQLGADAVMYAQEIVNRAERRIGQLLADVPREPGPGRGGKSIGDTPNVSARQEIGYALSRRSQQLAAIPDEVFEPNASRPVTRLARIAREAAAETRRASATDPVTVSGDIEIRHCGLNELDIEAGTADLVFTDPPYPREYLPLWSDLAKMAAAALKPGGLLVAYTGQYHLPEVMCRLGEHLTYTWCGAVICTGAHASMQRYRINVGSKPMLWYARGPYLPWAGWAPDTVRSPTPEKDAHEWQQSLGPALTLIERLTVAGDLVVDPFLGSGTTAVACHQLGRRFIGCDIDAAAVAVARERASA